MVWMNLTMQLKLLPATEQSDALLRTMERFNAACDALAAIAFANHCATTRWPFLQATTKRAGTTVGGLPGFVQLA